MSLRGGTNQNYFKAVTVPASQTWTVFGRCKINTVTAFNYMFMFANTGSDFIEQGFNASTATMICEINGVTNNFSGLPAAGREFDFALTNEPGVTVAGYTSVKTDIGWANTMTSGGGWGFTLANMFFLAETDGNSGLDMYVNDVRIWDGVAMTSNALLAERRSGRPVRAQNLLSWWKLTALQDINDWSGHGHRATVVGTPQSTPAWRQPSALGVGPRRSSLGKVPTTAASYGKMFLVV